MAEKPFDLIIVGAGQAGCALAGKIAESGVNPQTGEPLKIALFDRGPYFKGRPRSGYGASSRRQMFTNITQEFTAKYTHLTGMPPGGKRKVPLRGGQEVFTQRAAAIFGGGTLHYTAITHVPHEVDYQVWEEETGADWSYANLKPFADRINRDYNIHVRPEALLTRADRLFRDAARSMGYPVHDVTISKRNCLLSGYCDGFNMCKYDARQGSFMAYLPIAEERGVQMFPDCAVERILLQKKGGQVRVGGVEYIRDGTLETAKAPRVIVSCGNYGTPPLLYRSGYGPSQFIEGDLPVVNPNVGGNTDNRPQARGPVGIFDEPLTTGEFRHGGAFQVYLDTAGDQRYDRVEIGLQAMAVPRPDVVALNAGAPEFGRPHKAYMNRSSDPETVNAARKEFVTRCRSTMHLVRPRNIRGWINEWGEQIYPGNDPSILGPLEQGKELIYELLKKMGAREVRGMDRPVRVGHLNTFVSSCMVGTDPKSSVVDPNFESHDVEGLFICDGSVVPRAASQGYAGTVATVALLAASRIRERHFRRG